jgi:hypothetical protein
MVSLSSGGVPFDNLNPITDCAAVHARPHFYDGAPLSDIVQGVSEDLGTLIIPFSDDTLPAAPNFFLEINAPDEPSDVARRRAGLDGAIGARAMHALQNYSLGNGEPAFDGVAYTYSSTYDMDRGLLQIFAHHVAAPTSLSWGRPEYHMTNVGSFRMMNCREELFLGGNAFRNAMDQAREHRDRGIQAANARARQRKILVRGRILVLQ